MDSNLNLKKKNLKIKIKIEINNLIMYYIYNNQLINAEKLPEFSLSGNKVIYEVIRIMNGKVLFLEDHLERFNQSLLLSAVASPFKSGDIRNLINQLIQANYLVNGNIKFFLSIPKNFQCDFYAHLIPHQYPSVNDYQTGVGMVLYEANRINPAIKEEHIGQRERIQAFIKDHQVYEALLVNNDGYITEGSKSNFFLIKGDTLYTAPLSEVLEGITAKNLLKICNNNGIPVREEHIPAAKLRDYHSAFITGTSPKLLPVNRINDIVFDVNNVMLRQLMVMFDNLIEKYLSLP